MSFFKKMVKEFLDDDDKKSEGNVPRDRKEHDCLTHYLRTAHQGNHEYSNHQPQYAQHLQFGSPQPQGPPASYGAPPPMPPGWVSQWDQSSQRWYYIEHATGRSQWEPPSFASSAAGQYPPPPGAPLHTGGYGGQGGGYGYQQHEERGSFGLHTGHYEQEKKSKGSGGTAAAAVGGAAVGALGGAIIAHEMSMYHGS